MHSDLPSVRRDWVTLRGLDLLDELVGALQECQLALRSVRADVGLTLDELERDLRKARGSATLAYGAASLLHQGAELADSWINYPSRPKAVHVRHRIAVDHGAPPKVPTVSTADRYEEVLRESYEQVLRQSRGSSSGLPRAGKRCGTHLEYEARSCRRRVARTGPNEFADHCLDHMDDKEFELYERNRLAAAEKVVQAQRDECRRIADEWRAQRTGPRAWVDEVVRSTGWTS